MNRAEAPPIENGAPTQALLDELVRRIVAAVRPRRILLFGSADSSADRSAHEHPALAIEPLQLEVLV